MSPKNKIHGFREHRIYRIWRSMKLRCDVPSNTAYKYYGARGVSYCTEWSEFIAFLKDMGLPPDDTYSLDRINPNGNYERGNCRWLDVTRQNRNRRNSRFYDWKGQKMVISAIAEMEKVCNQRIRHFVKKRGMSIDAAMDHIRKLDRQKKAALSKLPPEDKNES